MQLNQDISDASFQIRAYEPGLIQVNNDQYRQSLIVAPELLIADWQPQSLTDFQVDFWQPVIELKPEIVLFGTGQQFILPKPVLLAPLYELNIGVECMDTGAACRTYCALTAESRNVVAALLIR